LIPISSATSRCQNAGLPLSSQCSITDRMNSSVSTFVPLPVVRLPFVCIVFSHSTNSTESAVSGEPRIPYPFLLRNSLPLRINALLFAFACSTSPLKAAGFRARESHAVQIAYPDVTLSIHRSGTRKPGLEGSWTAISPCSLSSDAFISQSTNFRFGVSAPHKTTVQDEPAMYSSRIFGSRNRSCRCQSPVLPNCPAQFDRCPRTSERTRHNTRGRLQDENSQTFSVSRPEATVKIGLSTFPLMMPLRRNCSSSPWAMTSISTCRPFLALMPHQS
jgi:hypothetical protein